jgi:hypothetical protein
VIDNEKDDTKVGQFFEVEKIVSHRKAKNNQFEYLVKWKNFSNADNTWEPADNFSEKDIITKYWSSLDSKSEGSNGKPETLNKKKQQKKILKDKILTRSNSPINRPVTRSSSLNSINSAYRLSPVMLVTALSLLLLPLIVAAKFELTDDFYICSEVSLFSTPIIAVDKGCEKKESHVSSILPNGDTLPQSYVLSKNVHEVYGAGFECSKEILEILESVQRFIGKLKTFKNFFSFPESGQHKTRFLRDI